MNWQDASNGNGSTLRVRGSMHGINVHRLIGDDPNDWFLTFYDLGIAKSVLVGLRGLSLEAAKLRAIGLVRARLALLSTDLETAAPMCLGTASFEITHHPPSGAHPGNCRGCTLASPKWGTEVRT